MLDDTYAAVKADLEQDGWKVGALVAYYAGDPETGRAECLAVEARDSAGDWEGVFVVPDGIRIGTRNALVAAGYVADIIAGRN